MTTKTKKQEVREEMPKSEAAKPETTAPAVQEPKALAQVGGLEGELLALGASPGLVRRAVKARTNFDLMESPKIPRIRMAGGGVGMLLTQNADEEPTKLIEGVIVFAAKYKSFYKEQYDEETKKPPECFSHNGKTPDPDSGEPQAKTCKGCPHNEFGSDARERGKACRDMRRIFFLTSIEEGQESVMPWHINATPTSIKAWDDYMTNLVMAGASYNEVVTRITAYKKKNTDTFCVLKFERVRTLDETQEKDAQVLRNIRALAKVWAPLMERQHVDAEELAEVDAEARANAQKAEAVKGEF